YVSSSFIRNSIYGVVSGSIFCSGYGGGVVLASMSEFRNNSKYSVYYTVFPGMALPTRNGVNYILSCHFISTDYAHNDARFIKAHNYFHANIFYNHFDVDYGINTPDNTVIAIEAINSRVDVQFCHFTHLCWGVRDESAGM